MGAKLRTQECCVSCKIKSCSVRNKIPSPKTLLIAPFLWLAHCYCCQTLNCCWVSTLFRIGVPQSPKGMWSSLCTVNFYGKSIKKNYYMYSHQKEYSMSRMKKKGHFRGIITKLFSFLGTMLCSYHVVREGDPCQAGSQVGGIAAPRDGHQAKQQGGISSHDPQFGDSFSFTCQAAAAISACHTGLTYGTLLPSRWGPGWFSPGVTWTLKAPGLGAPPFLPKQKNKMKQNWNKNNAGRREVSQAHGTLQKWINK